jgi:hypothetical protein
MAFHDRQTEDVVIWVKNLSITTSQQVIMMSPLNK